MPKKPATPKQLAANRANANQSTGPRTPEGKARSSQNARKSAFHPTKFSVVRIEDPELVANLQADAVATYQPATPEECLAVDRIALANLVILRLSALEAGLFTLYLDDGLTQPEQAFVLTNENLTVNLDIHTHQHRAYWTAYGFNKVSNKSHVIPLFLRYQAQAERQHRRAVEYFKFLRSLRHAPPPTPPNPPIEPKNEPIPDPQPAENTPSSPPAPPKSTNSPSAAQSAPFRAIDALLRRLSAAPSPEIRPAKRPSLPRAA